VHNIEMDLSETGWHVMDWIDLVQNSDQWRAIVNTAIYFRFQKLLGNP
jgi:hypothetical protein